MKKSSVSLFLVIAMLAAMLSGVTMSVAAEEPSADFVRASSIEVGCKILFVYPDAAAPKAAGPITGYTNTQTYLSSVDAVLSGETVSSEEALVFEVEAGLQAGTYAFKHDGKYLACCDKTTSDNYVFLTATERNADTDWFVSFDSQGNAVVSHPLTESVTRYLRYNANNPRFSSYKSGQKDIAIYKLAAEQDDSPEDIDVYFVDGTDSDTPYVYCYSGASADEYDETSEDLAYPGDPQIQPVGTEMGGHRYYKVTVNPASVDWVMFGNGSGSFSGSAEAGHTAGLPYLTDAVEAALGGNRFVVYSVRLENGVLLTTKVEDVWPEPAQVLREPTCTEAGSKAYVGLRTGALAGEESIAALGHAWDEGTVLTPATHQRAGEMEYKCTRCEVTTTEPIERLPNPFVDVIEGESYFFDAVMWALDHDPLITAGVDATHFGPGNPCTREQIVTFLWKAAGAPAPTSMECDFYDVQPGNYYYNAVLWAKEKGITSGMGDGSFGVGQPCTRAQAMTFLWVSQGRPTPTGGNPFTDVEEGVWYYNPIRWAVENRITAGMGDGTFGINVTCTRGQIITFLYKAFNLPKE